MNELVQILMSYIINFPILQDWESSMSKPIGLVFENRKMLAKALKTILFSCKLIEANASISTVKKILSRANSHGVAYLVGVNPFESAKAKTVMDLLLDANSYGVLDGKRISTAVILLFEGVVSKELKEAVYEIHLCENDLDVHSFCVEDVVPEASKLELIRDINHRFNLLGKESLFPSVAFLYPLRSSYEYEDLLEMAKKLDRQADEFSHQDGLVELFCDSFKAFVGDGEIVNIYALPEIDEDGVANIENALFFDNQFIYLNSKYFQKIFSEIFRTGVSIITLKTALLESGVIVADRGGFTTKMSYIKATGKFERARMIKLSDMAMQSANRGSIIDLLMEVV